MADNDYQLVIFLQLRNHIQNLTFFIAVNKIGWFIKNIHTFVGCQEQLDLLKFLLTAGQLPSFIAIEHTDIASADIYTMSSESSFFPLIRISPQ